MADWFKFYENGIYESRFQWAIHEESGVCPVWLWILSECCKHKADHFGWKGQDYELFGASHVVNLTPPRVNASINLLVKIGYIVIEESCLKVLHWNKFQSDYMRKRFKPMSGHDPDTVRTVSDHLNIEEKRVDKKEEEAPSFVKDSEKALNGYQKHRRTTLPKEWDFQQLWKKEWESFHSGQKCMWTFKDDQAVPVLLEIESDFLKIVEIAKKAWGLDGKNDFEGKAAIRFSSFVSQFNSIRKAVGNLQSKKPYKPEIIDKEIEKQRYLERIKKEEIKNG